MSKKLLIPLIGALVCGTGVMIFVVIGYLKRYHILTRWLRITAKVVDGEITNCGGDGSNYKPMIEYEYRVGSQSYTDKASPWGIVSGRRKSAETALSEYPAGSEIDVYVNGRTPEESVISPPPLWTILVGLIFSCIIYSVPVLVCLSNGGQN